MTPAIADWAERHGVSGAAIADLMRVVGVLAPVAPPPAADAPPSGSEAYVQSLIRLEAPRAGVFLFRNNVGALKDETGRVIRYGLANDSKKVNEQIKSSDLIGFRPVTITPAHVGTTIAQFVSRECKASGWKWTSTDRERAQLNWINLVAAHGGDAMFASREGTL